ncbi:uncharacterized protein RSE6_06674 [Rhynchosporium secalis]|uniref:Uncharacterized protein n=1 Tax=Rhynchosporium secalis TaxID=38038 RepID=A0A1E1MB03_RHYSE|nr:uncharacterized protein RSE6_06674 [Rhynchosporium secalis]
MPQAPAIMSTSTLPHLMPSQLLARPKVRLAGEAFRQFLKAKYEKRVAKRAAKAAVVEEKDSGVPGGEIVENAPSEVPNASLTRQASLVLPELSVKRAAVEELPQNAATAKKSRIQETSNPSQLKDKWKLVVTGFQAKKLVVLDQHQDPQTRTLIEKSKKPVFFEQHNNQQAQTHSVEQSREPSNLPSHPTGELDDCRVNQPKHGPDAHADAMRCVDKLLGLVHGHDGRILDKLNIEEWEILASDMIYETSGSQSCIMMPSWTSSHRSEKPSPHFRQHIIFFLPMNLNRTMVATIVDIPQQRLYIFGPSRLHQDLINRSEFILRVNDIPCGGSTWKHRGLEYQDDTTDSECAIWTMFFLKRHLTGETLDPHDYGVTDLRYRYARVFAYEYEALRPEISELLNAYRSVHRMGSSISLNVDWSSNIERGLNSGSQETQPSPSGAQRSNTTSFVSGTVASSLSTPGTTKDKREVSLGLGHLYATSPKVSKGIMRTSTSSQHREKTPGQHSSQISSESSSQQMVQNDRSSSVVSNTGRLSSLSSLHNLLRASPFNTIPTAKTDDAPIREDILSHDRIRQAMIRTNPDNICDRLNDIAPLSRPINKDPIMSLSVPSKQLPQDSQRYRSHISSIWNSQLSRLSPKSIRHQRSGSLTSSARSVTYQGVPDLSFNKPVSQPFIQNENPTRKDVSPTHHDPALRGSDGDDTLYPRSSMITTRNTDNA